MNRSRSKIGPDSGPRASGDGLHPAWRELMSLCERMGYGEIERLKIHDGLPALAEITRQKVKLG